MMIQNSTVNISSLSSLYVLYNLTMNNSTIQFGSNPVVVGDCISLQNVTLHVDLKNYNQNSNPNPLIVSNNNCLPVSNNEYILSASNTDPCQHPSTKQSSSTILLIIQTSSDGDCGHSPPVPIWVIIVVIAAVVVIVIIVIAITLSVPSVRRIVFPKRAIREKIIDKIKKDDEKERNNSNTNTNTNTNTNQ